MPTVLQLIKVGFSYRSAVALLAPSPTFKELVRAGLSTRQARTWLRLLPLVSPTLGGLTRGGFTRHQALLLLEVLEA